MLRPVVSIFESKDYPNLLVGLGDPDDAAVWKIDEERALVITTDFFTPVVDTPYEYGAIAAANSISDVYAMGGKPFLALNTAAFPPELPPEFLGEILRGGAEKAKEAGVVIAGGHTIQDKEPKYGLIVLGLVQLSKMMTKSQAKPGERLVLSKPLGFGTITTAIKGQQATREDTEEVIRWMTTLNDKSAQLAIQHGIKSATDITGFSLLGHAWEMAVNSGVGMRFSWEKIPFLPSAFKYAEEYIFPGGTSDNRLYFQPHVRFTRQLEEYEIMLLFDAQTSGGLLFSVPQDKLDALLAHAEEIGQPLWEIGEVVEGNEIEVV